ncbi:MAG: NlpC/P60 family protein [Cardiobacteriaceae bacterium]|nr:NlpC/P60 family protein [Cardiobacteriaceae bacterium]
MYSIEVETARSARLYPVGDTLAHAQLRVPEAWVFEHPDAQSARQSQYSYGEGLRLLADNGDFWLAQSLRDAYSGWVAKSALALIDHEPPAHDWRTRSVAPVTRAPSLKSPHLLTLPPDACFDIDDEQGDYLHIEALGWLHRHHAIRADDASDIVMTASEHIGRSYVWGGRGIAGLDCSALAQLCYRRAGHNLPRDTDLQQHFLHKFHQPVALDALAAGDLVYIPGHVMIAATADSVIHATAYHMQTVYELLDTVLARYRQSGGAEDRIKAYRWRE